MIGLRRSLGCLVLLLVFASAALAQTVSSSFTAAGEGNEILVNTGDVVTYTTSGTFVATWVIVRVDNGNVLVPVVLPSGSTLTGTGSASASFVAEPAGTPSSPTAPPVRYRFRVTAYTSGTVVTSLVRTVTASGSIAPVSGSIVAGQVAVGSGVNTIGGSPNFSFDEVGLHIFGDSDAQDGAYYLEGTGLYIDAYNYQGTELAKVALEEGDGLLDIYFDGFNGSSEASGAFIGARTTEDWTDSDNGTEVYFNGARDGENEALSFLTFNLAGSDAVTIGRTDMLSVVQGNTVELNAGKVLIDALYTRFGTEAEPDLTSGDGPSNSLSIVQNTSTQWNIVNAIASAASPEISVYKSRGTIASPGNLSSTDFMWGTDVFGRVAGAWLLEYRELIQYFTAYTKDAVYGIELELALSSDTAEAGFHPTANGVLEVNTGAPVSAGGSYGRLTAGFVTAGATPAVANVGANSCGTTAATIAGNNNNGKITVGATAGTQCRVTFTVAAPTARECQLNDATTTIATRSTYVDTTHSDFFGVFVAGDVLEYTCFAR